MMRHGIERFVGSWISAPGCRLRIRKLSADRASVNFLDPTGHAVQRPYMQGAPSEQMVARYDDYNGLFEVELWNRHKGFTLHLDHENEYELDTMECVAQGAFLWSPRSGLCMAAGPAMIGNLRLHSLPAFAEVLRAWLGTQPTAPEQDW